jgi:hypothetical protein
MTSSSTVVFPEKWARARTLHPQAQGRFLKLLQDIEAKGFLVDITSSFRAGGNDAHGFGLALDVNLVHAKTKQRYGMHVGKTSKADWEATGIPALIRASGFRWGGDFYTRWKDLQGNWHEAYDPVHIDLCGKYPLDLLRGMAVRKAAQAKITLAQLDRRILALA